MDGKSVKTAEAELRDACSVATADELVHTVAETIRAGMKARLDAGYGNNRRALQVHDATLLTLATIVTAWLNGPNHKCAEHGASDTVTG